MAKPLTGPALFKASDVAISMSISFKNDKQALGQIKGFIAKGMWEGFKYFRNHFETLVMTPMILGGTGWKSVETMPAWKWINSPEGWGQLGFRDAGEPIKLLVAMGNSYEVQLIGGPSMVGPSQVKIGLKMGFFDLEELRKATVHPAAGEGALDGNRSWFDWVYKGNPISEPAKFISRSKGGKDGSDVKSARSYDIAGSKAGIMAQKGTSFWEVPPRFRLDMDKLLQSNEQKIRNVMENTVATVMNRYFNS